MGPVISLIVPVYNAEEYLRECLDSVLAQTFTDWECILVDDGSTDASGAICAEYARRDSRFRPVRQDNAGISGARNTGIGLATGRYLVFLDNDDGLDVRELEVVSRWAQTLRPEQILMWNSTLDRAELGSGADRPLRPFLDREHCSGDEFVRILPPWNKLFRADVVRERNVRFELGCIWSEDIRFFMAYLQALAAVTGKRPELYSLDAALYYYRLPATNVTTRRKAERIPWDLEMYGRLRPILEQTLAFPEPWMQVADRHFYDLFLHEFRYFLEGTPDLTAGQRTARLRQYADDPVIRQAIPRWQQCGCDRMTLFWLRHRQPARAVWAYYRNSDPRWRWIAGKLHWTGYYLRHPAALFRR